jgi:hypothetical protein
VSDKLVEGLRKAAGTVDEWAGHEDELLQAADRIEELERALRSVVNTFCCNTSDREMTAFLRGLNAVLNPSAAPEPQKGPYPPR